MRIDRIASSVGQNLSTGITKLGRKVQNQGSFFDKANHFVEGRGINPGRGAFLALIYSCTVVPRFLKARDADERMEIVRRDLITITTICFAMKAIKAGACKIAEKQSGIPLTYTNMKKDANPLAKALGYFQQKGTTAYDADVIAANCAGIKGKDQLVRFLHFVDDNGGNVGKVLTFDRAKTGFFSKNKTDGALTKASKRLLGEDFDFLRGGKDIINVIEGLDKSNSAFSDISRALRDEHTNPIVKFGQGISAKFETASLVAVAGFLGFGLPKLNEKMTKDKYFNKKDGGALKTPYQNPNYPIPEHTLYNVMNTTQRGVFQNFLGNMPQGAVQNLTLAASNIDTQTLKPAQNGKN